MTQATTANGVIRQRTTSPCQNVTVKALSCGAPSRMATMESAPQIAPQSAIAFFVYESMRGWLAKSGVFRSAADAENPFADGL